MSRISKSTGAVATLAVLALLAAPGGVAAAKTLRASMNGDREVPKGDSDGRGTARITTNRAKGKVCFSITLSKVGTVVAGHIHKAGNGKAGPVVVALFAAPTKQPKGCATGVSKSLIRDIERHPGRYYVNVHNQAHPEGAVRGQRHA